MKFRIFAGLFLVLASCGPQESEVQGLSTSQQNAVAASDEKIVFYFATMSNGNTKCGGCVAIKDELESAGILVVNGDVPTGFTSKYASHFKLQYCHTDLQKKSKSTNMDVGNCVESTTQIARIVDEDFKDFNSVPFFGLYMEKSKFALPSYSTMYVDGEKAKGTISETNRPSELVNMIKGIVEIRTQAAKPKQTSKTNAPAKAEKETLPDASVPVVKPDASSGTQSTAASSSQQNDTSQGDTSVEKNETSGFSTWFARFFKGFFETMKNNKTN